VLIFYDESVAEAKGLTTPSLRGVSHGDSIFSPRPDFDAYDRLARDYRQCAEECQP
jgi:hypothetical protein